MQMSVSVWNQLLSKAAERVSADEFQGYIDILLEKRVQLCGLSLKEKLKSTAKAIRVLAWLTAILPSEKVCAGARVHMCCVLCK